MKNGCTIRTAVRLVALAGVVGVTAFANAAPPSSANVTDKAQRPALSTGAGKATPKAVMPSSAASQTPAVKAEIPPMEGVRGTPPNDDCANAIAVANPSVTAGDTIGATADAVTACTLSNPDGVWYTFVGQGGVAIVETCSFADYDTALHAYSGTCGSLTCLAGNDDTCGLQSRVAFATTAGTTYYILVEGFSSGQGNFELSISEPPPCEVNCPKGSIDENEPDCGLPVDTVNGGCNFVPPLYTQLECGQTICASAAADANFRDTDWYRIDLTEGTEITWSMDQACFDWLIFIIDAGPGADCSTGAAILQVLTGPAGTSGSISQCLPAGSWVVWAGPQTFAGVPCPAEYSATLSCVPCDATPPENDNCADAIAITCGSVTEGTNAFATIEPNDPFNCLGIQGPNSVWYSFVATNNSATVSLCNTISPIDTVVQLLDGSCKTGFTAVACNDDSCGLYSSATAFGTLVPGNTYYIEVALFSSGPGGDFVLQLDCFDFVPCEVPCPKGSFEEGELDCGLPIDTTNGGCNSVPEIFQQVECGTTICANGAAQGNFRDTDWFELNTTSGTEITWTMEESCFDWLIFIINLNSGCAGLIIEQVLTGPAGTGGSISACLPAGRYAVWAGTQVFDGVPCGEYRATVSCVPCDAEPPANDECANAQSITCNSSTDFDNSFASTNPNDPFFNCHVFGPNQGFGTVWFTFVATDVSANISTCNSINQDSLINVFAVGNPSDPCNSLVEIGCSDDACGASGFLGDICVDGLTIGDTYYVEVAAWSGADQGQYTLELVCPCPPPCDTGCPKGATDENEPDCGIPADFVNGGCNSVPPVFSPIECGETYCGTAGNNGSFRDTDWYEVVVDAPIQLTWTVTADFVALIGLIENFGVPTCPAGSFRFFAFTGGDCTTASIVADLTPGTYWFFVATQGFGGVSCGAPYTASLTGEGCGGLVDCNKNGIDDAQDIANGARDCFDFNAAQTPGGPYTAGGANGIPDECECVADWNRDGVANSTDVGEHINSYFFDQSTGLTIFADVDCNGISNSTDVGEFINIYFAAQASQLPFSGCQL